MHFIYSFPEQNNFIDLSIYRDGGQLISHGINPYDFNDGKELRNLLRLDDVAFVEYVSQSQEVWDFYSSGNLPLSLLFFGAIEKIFNGDPVAYRIVFAFFDSILSSLIVLFLLKFWHLKKSLLNMILMLGIGALSPTLLFWGTILPEDKGLQILFMLLAIYFAKDKKIFLSAIFMGCSIAYKGLGVFVFPVCLFFLLEEPGNIFKINRPLIIKGCYFSLLTLFFSIIWFIPFLPNVLYMMLTRMDSNIGVDPSHASVWIFAKNLFPVKWLVFKNILVYAAILLWSFQFIYKKINIVAMSLFLLVLFVDILLLAGSLDRMNIGIIVSIVVFGFVNPHFARILGWYSIIAGSFHFFSLEGSSYNENHDAFYVLGYLILFSLYPLFYSEFYVNMRMELKSKLLQIFIKETDKYNNKPLLEMIINIANEHKIDKIFIRKNVENFETNSVTKAGNTLDSSLNSQVIIEIIDSEEKILNFSSNINKLLEEINGSSTIENLDHKYF
ncbi:MAG: DUF190 domain-containing protein [Bacteroidetes bacterium]|nr:DUF190 domain-containing protein [Bacteroidota bacterium]HET6244977.1 DUF190 domain-containing protein [Bacteroidia bacterium]